MLRPEIPVIYEEQKELIFYIIQDLLINNLTLLSGPTGVGKTALARTISFHFYQKIFEMEGTSTKQLEEFLINYKSDNANVTPIPAKLSKALTTGGIFILNEANMLRPELLTILIQLTEPGCVICAGTRFGNQKIKVHPNFKMILTVNEGYIGTGIISGTVKRRVNERRVGYFSSKIMSKMVQAKILQEFEQIENLDNYFREDDFDELAKTFELIRKTLKEKQSTEYGDMISYQNIAAKLSDQFSLRKMIQIVEMINSFIVLRKKYSNSFNEQSILENLIDVLIPAGLDYDLMDNLQQKLKKPINDILKKVKINKKQVIDLPKEDAEEDKKEDKISNILNDSKITELLGLLKNDDMFSEVIASMIKKESKIEIPIKSKIDKNKELVNEKSVIELKKNALSPLEEILELMELNLLSQEIAFIEPVISKKGVNGDNIIIKDNEDNKDLNEDYSHLNKIKERKIFTLNDDEIETVNNILTISFQGQEYEIEVVQIAKQANDCFKDPKLNKRYIGASETHRLKFNINKILSKDNTLKIDEKDVIYDVLSQKLVSVFQQSNLFNYLSKSYTSEYKAKHFITELYQSYALTDTRKMDHQTFYRYTENIQNALVLFEIAFSIQQGVLLIGESGVGKSTLCQDFADKKNVAYVSVNAHRYFSEIGNLQDKILVDGKIVEIPGLIAEAFIKGGVVEIREFNFARSSALSFLNGLLEKDKIISIDGVQYRRHPHFMLVLTCNPNSDRFPGTNDPNEALINRLLEVELGFPEEKDERFLFISYVYDVLLKNNVFIEDKSVFIQNIGGPLSNLAKFVNRLRDILHNESESGLTDSKINFINSLPLSTHIYMRLLKNNESFIIDDMKNNKGENINKRIYKLLFNMIDVSISKIESVDEQEKYREYLTNILNISFATQLDN